MKKYFYSNTDEKHGPLSFEDLKNENINNETMVWFEGLEDWTPAKEVKEMIPILELKPPPIPDLDKEFEFENIDENAQKRETIEKQDVSPIKSTQGMFTRPFSFDGRIRRTEYGISFIIYVLLAVIVNDLVESGEFPIIIFAYFPLLWFLWGQGAKRCHDMGNSGWYQIIPFYVLWMLFSSSDSGMNEYGINPKD